MAEDNCTENSQQENQSQEGQAKEFQLISTRGVKTSEVFRKRVTNIKIDKEYSIFDLTFYEAMIGNVKCVMLESGIGKVNAARSCQILIDNIGVDYIFNVGVAGGVINSLKIGDIVELTNTFPYEYSYYRGDSSYSPLFVVVETDGVNAKLVSCSNIKTTHEAHSIYDKSQYEVKFSQDKYDEALKGVYDRKEIRDIDLLKTKFTVVTKNFKLTE